MTEKEEERLRAFRESRRPKATCPKRMTEDELRALLDTIEERRSDEPGQCYWRWVPCWWTTVLATRFDWGVLPVRGGSRSGRRVVIFQLRDMMPLMELLRLHTRYLHFWFVNNGVGGVKRFTEVMNRLQRLAKDIEQQGR